MLLTVGLFVVIAALVAIGIRQDRKFQADHAELMRACAPGPRVKVMTASRPLSPNRRRSAVGSSRHDTVDPALIDDLDGLDSTTDGQPRAPHRDHDGAPHPHDGG